MWLSAHSFGCMTSPHKRLYLLSAENTDWIGWRLDCWVFSLNISFGGCAVLLNDTSKRHDCEAAVFDTFLDILWSVAQVSLGVTIPHTLSHFVKFEVTVRPSRDSVILSGWEECVFFRWHHILSFFLSCLTKLSCFFKSKYYFVSKMALLNHV